MRKKKSVKVKKISKAKTSSTSAGHRKRLRNKFLQGGLDGFLDYEVIELLLTLGTPRKDCKQMAKQAVKKFNNLQGVLDASLEELQQIKGIGPDNAFGIKLFQTISERYEKEKITKKVPLTSPEKVVNYLRKRIGRKQKEHFLLICLDARNNLIKVCDISIGSLDKSIVHPREVFKQAIQVLAARVIVAHNHPSGSLQKSKEDKKITQRLAAAGDLLGIEVIDHLIITKNDFLSLKEQGWI